MPRRARTKHPVFFVDRSLGGKRVPEALRLAGATVIAHDDVFDQNATDVAWLAEAGRRGWVVLTKDGEILRNPHEKAMFRSACARVFTLARRNLAGEEMAQLFVAALPGMIGRVSSTSPPFVFSISRKCEFRRLD